MHIHHMGSTRTNRLNVAANSGGAFNNGFRFQRPPFDEACSMSPLPLSPVFVSDCRWRSYSTTWDFFCIQLCLTCNRRVLLFQGVKNKFTQRRSTSALCSSVSDLVCFYLKLIDQCWVVVMSVCNLSLNVFPQKDIIKHYGNYVGKKLMFCFRTFYIIHQRPHCIKNTLICGWVKKRGFNNNKVRDILWSCCCRENDLFLTSTKQTGLWRWTATTHPPQPRPHDYAAFDKG